jgi:hypothetical protein
MVDEDEVVEQALASQLDRAFAAEEEAELAVAVARARHTHARARAEEVLGPGLWLSDPRPLGPRAGMAIRAHRTIGELGARLLEARAAREAHLATIRRARRALRARRKGRDEG